MVCGAVAGHYHTKNKSSLVDFSQKIIWFGEVLYAKEGNRLLISNYFPNALPSVRVKMKACPCLLKDQPQNQHHGPFIQELNTV